VTSDNTLKGSLEEESDASYLKVHDAVGQNDMCVDPPRWSPSDMTFRSALFSTIHSLIRKVTLKHVKFRALDCMQTLIDSPAITQAQRPVAYSALESLAEAIRLWDRATQTQETFDSSLVVVCALLCCRHP
jgi:hypothetical protein